MSHRGKNKEDSPETEKFILELNREEVKVFRASNKELVINVKLNEMLPLVNALCYLRDDFIAQFLESAEVSEDSDWSFKLCLDLPCKDFFRD